MDSHRTRCAQDFGHNDGTDLDAAKGAADIETQRTPIQSQIGDGLVLHKSYKRASRHSHHYQTYQLKIGGGPVLHKHY